MSKEVEGKINILMCMHVCAHTHTLTPTYTIRCVFKVRRYVQNSHLPPYDNSST